MPYEPNSEDQADGEFSSCPQAFCHSFESVSLQDEDKLTTVEIELIDGRVINIELDLPESARAWHDDLDKALFSTFTTQLIRSRTALTNFVSIPHDG